MRSAAKTRRGARAVASSKKAAAALFWCFSLYFFSVCACSGTATSSVDTNIAGWRRVHRRSLGGPGSYPPRCVGKCGGCHPCRPVNVTVPPGMPVTAEYYPEAWRCKCGNRLYIP